MVEMAVRDCRKNMYRRITHYDQSENKVCAKPYGPDARGKSADGAVCLSDCKA